MVCDLFKSYPSPVSIAMVLSPGEQMLFEWPGEATARNAFFMSQQIAAGHHKGASLSGQLFAWQKLRDQNGHRWQMGG